MSLKFDESARTHNARLDDGYTRVGHIKPVDRLHEGITWTYRRMQAVDVRETDNAIDAFERSGKAGEAEKLRAAKIAANVQKWSEIWNTSSGDEPMPVKVDHVLKLPSLLIGSMYNIIAGWLPSDPQDGALPDGNTPEAQAEQLLRDANREAGGDDSGNS